MLDEDLSFRAGVSRSQVKWLRRCYAILGLSVIAVPAASLYAVSGLLFCLFATLVTWRVFLIFIGMCIRMTRATTPSVIDPDEDLPIYTILIPLYQEADLVPQMAASLARIDWPSARLDIQILMEDDDVETLAAARAAPFPFGTRLMRIPPGGPRTKPNALNVGLSEARGRFLTVYDAEDLPHPDQLRAAYRGFSQAPASLVCLQAPLVGDAKPGNWLSAQWALEYAVQFGLLLPGLSLYRMPILIGGTSNHFKTTALQALGGWDAWNVTEDADLGMRVARAGLFCGTILVPTHEDPPTELNVWLAQRSRWIKGFLQSWLVLMRNPGKTLHQMGILPFFMMQVTLGGAILTPICHAPCAAIFVGAVISPDLAVGPAGWTLMIVALIVGLIGDLCAPAPRTWQRWIATFSRPLYWPLHSIAAYRAIWELAKAPFFWAKTPHAPRKPEDLATCSIGLLASASPPA